MNDAQKAKGQIATMELIVVNFNHADFLDNRAKEKSNDFDNEATIWIFDDSSALRIDSMNSVEVITNHGFHVDNIKLS